MTTFLKGYFGSKLPAAPPAPEHTPVRAIPASWYTSPAIYELEKRAIFAKKWLLTTHKARVRNPTDWLPCEVANFGFIIYQDAQGHVKAFHHDCKQKGAEVIHSSCQCDSWPSESLDKAHSQRPIHTKVDALGFVWINMDDKEVPESKWSDEFDAVDEHERFNYYNFEDYNFDHVWEIDGHYNWKIGADNYNECYHCRVAHPDIPTVADLNTYYVETQKSYIQHFGTPTKEQIARGFRVAITYFLPNASINVSPHFFMIQRFIPHSPTRSTIRYEFFRNQKSSDEDYNTITELYKRVMSEDKYLCANSQKNVNAGIFVNGEMHPTMEQGPIFFQANIRKMLREQHQKEMAEEESR